MNKNKIEKLWNALTACTHEMCAPYDHVVVGRGGNVYATNEYVLHRIESAPTLLMRLHGNDMSSIDGKNLDNLLETSKRNYINLTNFYDSKLLDLAIRPHKALGATVMLMCGRGHNAPMVIQSTTPDGDRVIRITTAIMGKRA